MSLKIQRTVTFIFLVFMLLWSNREVHATPQIIDPDSLQQSVGVDSFSRAEKAYFYIRGLERRAAPGFHPLRPLWRGLTYVPRQMAYGIQYASGYASQIIDDPKFIDNLEDFFVSKDHSLGWYPILTLTSGIRPKGGVHFFIKRGNWQTIFRGTYADEEKYQTRMRISGRIRRPQKIWQFSFEYNFRYDDDLEFYGFGNNPRADQRSHFLTAPRAEYGVYFQRWWTINFTAGLRLNEHWEFFWNSGLVNYHLNDAFEGANAFSRTFDLNYFPAFKQPLHSLNHVLTVRYDSRPRNRYLARGNKIEGALGLSRGTGDNPRRTIQAGFDFLSSFSVIQKNRLLLPRMVFETVMNLTPEFPLAITSYPGQNAFRGVSHRKRLRVDRYSLVPSLEYQWPLSFNLSGHLFLDYLIVTHSLKQISVTGQPWALGLALDFHGVDAELVWLQMTYGSEGFRGLLNIGWEKLFD